MHNDINSNNEDVDYKNNGMNLMSLSLLYLLRLEIVSPFITFTCEDA